MNDFTILFGLILYLLLRVCETERAREIATIKDVTRGINGGSVGLVIDSNILV